MNTKKAYEEYDKWMQQYNEAAVPAVEKEGHKSPATYILEKLFKEIALDIFKHDKEGNLEYNDKGKPKINWIGVITSLASLIGKIIFLRRMYDAGVAE